MLLLLVFPTSLTCIFDKENFKVSLALILRKKYSLVGLTEVINKKPFASIIGCLTLIVDFKYSQICLTNIINDKNFYISLTGIFN